MPDYLCGIELGGSTAAVAIADENGDIKMKHKGIKLENPATMVLILSQHLKNSNMPCSSIGIASFGPLDAESGKIGRAPKRGWEYFPLKDEIQKHFPNIPIRMETDVNAPALSEYTEVKKENSSIKSLAYITIGTGIGLGLYSDDKIYHGRLHPEFGHIYLKRMQNDTFEGSCHIHGDCLEGLISSAAIAKRLGFEDIIGCINITNDDPIWDMFVEYIGQACANAALSYSLDAIVIGGGIITDPRRGFLYERIHQRTGELLNDYIATPLILKPHFGADAGLIGALYIAKEQLKASKPLNSQANDL